MRTPIRSLTIKRAGITVCLCLIYSLSYSQSLSDNFTSDFNLTGDEIQSQPEDEKWPSVNLSMNLAGFLLTGPVIQADFKVAKSTYIGAYYVYHKLGLFAGKLIFDSDITSFSPKSMGAGIHAKHYFKNGEKQNSWYCGIYLGYSYNEARYNSGFPNETVERVNDLLIIGSGGYRWNFGEHLYVITGIQMGVAYAYDDKLYSSYTLNPGTGLFVKEETLHSDYSGDIYPYPLPEITLGIDF